MPNVQVSMYLTDEIFNKYAEHKKFINDIARAAMKSALKKVK